MKNRFNLFENKAYAISIEYPYNWNINLDYQDSIVTFIASNDYKSEICSVDEIDKENNEGIYPNINVIEIMENDKKTEKTIEKYVNDIISGAKNILNEFNILEKKQYINNNIICFEIIYDGILNNLYEIRFIQFILKVNKRIFLITCATSIKDFEFLVNDYRYIKDTFSVFN